jgi:hypothetical protein
MQVYSNPSSFEFATTFQKLKSDLNTKSYDKNSAGLIAFFKILQNGNVKLTGKEIAATAISTNTNFKTVSPQLYAGLKEIEEISSKNGIVTVKLNNPESFGAANLKFEKISQFRIMNYKSGNLDIVVLSGITYKPYFKEYPINYFRIYKSSDEIMIDYDADNDQKLINIGKDLLK